MTGLISDKSRRDGMRVAQDASLGLADTRLSTFNDDGFDF